MKIKQAFFIIICLFYNNETSPISLINLKYNYTISPSNKINILQDSLKAKLDIIQNGIDENEKLLANQEFISILRRTLELKISFDFTFAIASLLDVSPPTTIKAIIPIPLCGVHS